MCCVTQALYVCHERGRAVAQARAAVDAINRSWAGELKAARAGEADDRMSKARDAVRLAHSQIVPSPHHIT